VGYVLLLALVIVVSTLKEYFGVYWKAFYSVHVFVIFGVFILCFISLNFWKLINVFYEIQNCDDIFGLNQAVGSGCISHYLQSKQAVLEVI